MGWMDTLMNGLPSNPIRQQREATVASTKQQTADAEQLAQQREQKFHMDALDKYLGMGANIVGPGGVVHEKMNDTSAPVDMPDGYRIRPADPKRTVTIGKGADQVQLELPTPEAQNQRALYQHMQETMGGPSSPYTQAREAGNQAESDAQAAKYGGQKRGQLDAEAADTAANGFDLPAGLEEALPGITKGPNGQPRRVKSGELDDITRATGQYANYQSEAKNRNTPKPIGAGHEVTDDDGNTTMVTQMSDGSVKEVKLNAKGKTAKAPGGTTEYQQFQMDRSTANDAHGRAMVWQNKLDKLEEEGSTLAKENVAHGQEMTELGTQLENGELTGKDKAQAIRRKNLLQSMIDGNNEKFKAVASQKRSALKIKDSIMAANGGAVGQEQARANAAPKTATMAQIKTYAAKYGLDVAAAQKAFEADGITIAK